jgi:hypothetical protein
MERRRKREAKIADARNMRRVNCGRENIQA